ncbi:MAG: SWIM zinc finger family protein [Kiritimatiellae bacterium]|nr:SWIM zinc finger family protein [Kiritimatiellia bacterium]
MAGKKNYPARIARAALGLRAQSVRTVKTWWTRRWLQSLEDMRLGARLGRGRTYAADGQVVELTRGELDGEVRAQVVGSRPEPYIATLHFSQGNERAREEIASAISSEPMLLGRLLTGDLPLEIAEMFRTRDLPLFPAGGTKGNYDVTMKCTCPDWSRPCKHIVAVLLLLGEEISRYPMTLLNLRGIDLAMAHGTDAPCDIALANVAATDANPAPLVRRLGAMPYWRGFAKFPETLLRIAAKVRPVALKAAAGESIDLRH